MPPNGEIASPLQSWLPRGRPNHGYSDTSFRASLQHDESERAPPVGGILWTHWWRDEPEELSQ